MSKYEVDTTKHILVRKKLEENGQEDVVIYNDYNGSFNFNQDVERATRFDDKEKAEQLAEAQNAVSKIMNNNYEYNVIKESTVRELTTEETPDDEVEEQPDEPQENTQENEEE